MKTMRVNKTVFLQRLESVEPGLSKKPETMQSNCLVFRGGRVHTFNGETLTCRCPSGLPKEFAGAVPAGNLLATLRKINAEDLDLYAGREGDDNVLYVARPNERLWVRMDKEITLPIDQIEKPESWGRLSPDFSEATGVVQDCVADDPSKDTGCVHVHPKWVEASDGIQCARYRMRTGFDAPFMLRGDAVKFLSNLGMSKVALTPAWAHFKNPTGLVVSLRRYYEDSYPDIEEYLKVDGGEPATLPAGLADAVQAAVISSQEIKDEGSQGMLLVKLKPGKCMVEGRGVTTGYERKLKLRYDGPPLAFKIKPAILEMVCKKFNEVVVSKDKLAVKAARWVYTTCLTDPTEPAKFKEPEIPEGGTDDGE